MQISLRDFRKIIRDLKHYSVHVLIGLVWAWILREIWNEFVPHLFLMSIIGSLVLDVDHLLHTLVYDRRDWYAKQVRQFLKQGEIRNLWSFIRDNHKYNSGLLTHNIYFLGFFLILAVICFITDRNSGVVFFGAMVLHLITDMVDDIYVLGQLNWHRWGKIRVQKEGEV